MARMDVSIVIAVLLAYLIGSVPTSVWVGKVFFRKDIRSYGSGNAGATNTIRVLGTGVGIAVLLLDVFKGWIAVHLSGLFYSITMTNAQMTMLKVLMATAVILGHIFPLFAGFRGGKGVATSLGAGIALFPEAFLLAFGVFVLVFLLTRYVSLGSIIAALTLPVFVALVFRENTPLVVFSGMLAVFIPVTHKKNIHRLVKGKESKFRFRKTEVEKKQ